MNRIFTHALVVLAFATPLPLIAAEEVYRFQLDESYPELAPAAGEPPIDPTEIDHNIMPGVPIDVEDALGASLPPAEIDEVPVTSLPAELPPPAKPKVKAPARVVAEPIEPAVREIPLIETQNEASAGPDVTYVTGGVGEEERGAIEAAKADYNLHIISASHEGAFVGDARVTIRQKGGEGAEMLNVVAGPLLYVRLPTGVYEVEAKLGQQSKRQTVTVRKKVHRSVSIWVGK